MVATAVSLGTGIIDGKLLFYSSILGKIREKKNLMIEYNDSELYD